MDARIEEPVVYRQRAHALAPEVEFGIDRSTLSWADAKGHSGAVDLARITGVRVVYDPSRLILPRWIVDVWTQGDKKLRFTSSTLIGSGGFRPRHAAFLAFLAALHQALADKAPRAECHFGPNLASYLLHVVLWWLPVLALGWGAYLGFITSIASAGVFFGFITLYAAQFALRYTYYNYPRAYAPTHPPLTLLPKADARDV